jgi:hypothetical protein
MDLNFSGKEHDNWKSNQDKKQIQVAIEKSPHSQSQNNTFVSGVKSCKCPREESCRVFASIN